MTKAQQWLDRYYPKHTRNQVRRLDISDKKLEGELNLEGFINLEYLDCSKNLLTKININKVEPEKLKGLIIYDNNFSQQDLSSLARFEKLTRLLLGNRNKERITQGTYNRFMGTLEYLKNMNNLNELDITATDIDSGWAYLPNSLKKIWCLKGEREEAKVRIIAQSLKNYKIGEGLLGEWEINMNPQDLGKLLFKAIEKNDIRTIKKIFNEVDEKELDIDAYDEYGNTLLHYEVSKGNLEVTEILLEFGADANIPNKKDKFTPLHIAVGQNYRKIIIILLEKSADPNARDKEGNTPLHFAAENNNLWVLKKLFKHSGDINSVNEYNWSVLHSAASGILDTANTEENWDIIEWLLKKKADVTVKSGGKIGIEDVFREKKERYSSLVEKTKKSLEVQSSQQTQILEKQKEINELEKQLNDLQIQEELQSHQEMTPK